MFALTRNLVLAAAVAAIAGCAATAGMPSDVQTGQSKLGPVLTDANGMTLYTFTKDPAGKSVCNGKCAENWPPLAADADARASGKFTIVVRDDGSRQWAYGGRPLYGWVKDSKPGDTTGDGVNKVWLVARP